MSAIDEIFREERIGFGIGHRPNWEGLVFGKCQISGCFNATVGYFLGGFCKVCSIRTPDTRDLITSDPKINWTKKNWVKDLSHRMTARQRSEFYHKPRDEER